MLEKEIYEIIEHLAKVRLDFLNKNYPAIPLTLEKVTNELIDMFLNPKNSIDAIFKEAVWMIREARSNAQN